MENDAKPLNSCCPDWLSDLHGAFHSTGKILFWQQTDRITGMELFSGYDLPKKLPQAKLAFSIELVYVN